MNGTSGISLAVFVLSRLWPTVDQTSFSGFALRWSARCKAANSLHRR